MIPPSLKALFIVTLLAGLYLIATKTNSDGAKDSLTSNTQAQHVADSDASQVRMQQASTSSILSDYVDTCLRRSEEAREGTEPQLFFYDNIDDLKEHSAFFDAMSEPMTQGEIKLAKLIAYHRTQPAPLVALEVVRVCAATPELEKCHPALFDTLHLLPSDALPWIYLANYFAARGNTEKVRYAMTRALQADFYGNDYAERMVELSEQLNQHTSSGLYSAVIAVIGIEASNLVFPSELFSFCKQASSELHTASLCHQLGQDMASRSKTTRLSVAGTSLIKMMREVSDFHFPNQEKANNASYDEGDMLLIWPLMQYNERLLLNWLSDLQALGESQAAYRAIETVNTLAQSKDYTHCANSTN